MWGNGNSGTIPVCPTSESSVTKSAHGALQISTFEARQQELLIFLYFKQENQQLFYTDIPFLWNGKLPKYYPQMPAFTWVILHQPEVRELQQVRSCNPLQPMQVRSCLLLKTLLEEFQSVTVWRGGIRYVQTWGSSNCSWQHEESPVKSTKTREYQLKKLHTKQSSAAIIFSLSTMSFYTII